MTNPSCCHSPPQDNPVRLAYSIDDAAFLLSIGKTLMRELARDGQIRTVKIRDRTVVPRAALEEVVGIESAGHNGCNSLMQEEAHHRLIRQTLEMNRLQEVRREAQRRRKLSDERETRRMLFDVRGERLV